MVADFREYHCYSLVCFGHQVVEHKKCALFSVENIQVWKSLVKLNLRILIKNFLVDAIAPHHFIDCGLHHMWQMIYKTQSKLCFAAG